MTSKSPGRRMWRRGAAWLIVVAVMAMVVAAARYGGVLLVVSHAVADPGAIVSLASHEWERLPLAARLAAAYPGALVVLTEPQPVTEFNCHDCANRVSRLEELGVDEPRVRVLPIVGQGTHGEALTVLGFVREAGIPRVLVVTSPYHTRRSLATFRSVFDGSGIAVGVEPARESSPARPGSWWRGAYDRAYVFYEWAAIVHYALVHGVGWRHYQVD